MNINAEAGPSSSPSSSPSPLPRRTSSRLDIVAGATYATPRTNVDGPAPTKTVDQGDQGYGRLEDLDLDAALEGFKVDGDHRQRDGGLLWDEKQISKENEERDYYDSKADDFLRLHESVQGSNELLSTLQGYLTTFRSDMATVSDHLNELQAKSDEIDEVLEGRRSAARSLHSLASSLIIPPDLINLIRDTMPGDAWLTAIKVLEEKIAVCKRLRKGDGVKAAEEVERVVEGLKAKAIVSLRTFLLSLIKPIRSTVRTHIQMIQSSVLLKYLPFFTFLRRQAPKIAAEVQCAYVASARTYYETSFRRYARALGQVKARARGAGTERVEYLGGNSAAETVQAALINAKVIGAVPTSNGTGENRRPFRAELKYSRLAGEPVITLPQAEDPNFTAPIEAVFRSLMLVLLDNASSEFTFLVRFFAPTRPLPSGDADINVATSSFTPRSGNQSTENLFSSPPPVGGPLRRLSRKDSAMSALSLSAASVAAATGGRDDLLRPADSMSQVGEDDDDDDYHRGSINGSVTNRDGVRRGTGGKVSLLSSEALKELEGVWRQVMETAVEYCQAQLDILLEPLAPPPTLSLMGIIRLNDRLLREIDERGCSPLESLLFSLKLKTWPMLSKQMDAHVESVKRLADAATPSTSGGGAFGAMMSGFGAGLAGKAAPPKDAVVKQVCERYAGFVADVIGLSTVETEVTLNASLARLRTELVRLKTAQAARFKPAASASNATTATTSLDGQRQSFLSSLYEIVLTGLRAAQTEMFANDDRETLAQGEGSGNLLAEPSSAQLISSSAEIKRARDRLGEEIAFFAAKEAEARSKAGGGGAASSAART